MKRNNADRIRQSACGCRYDCHTSVITMYCDDLFKYDFKEERMAIIKTATGVAHLPGIPIGEGGPAVTNYRHPCGVGGWPECVKCGRRIHMRGCTSRRDPKKDCDMKCLPESSKGETQNA